MLDHSTRLPAAQNASQQGPDNATKLVWVVRPELQQRYGLPAEIPADIQAELAASVKQPRKRAGEFAAAGCTRCIPWSKC